ncbi:LuxR C-terminal-related transcriptional regulator [Streptomyces sp. ST2-7A]|uniref:LuxR C-terminal-related transcriptional regulator n=1 Tax=Streptomyces sp. ST2-7A TaxID=2907214 RepID=UPI001F466838|nr:LuxR C-terminal-related transcriptional regulator [Streptomyces sp. ST2-7A]MCE7082638.1 LuxR C-terminal-related transcriptional regulator [Streptomyces sp. ST2-7A]
MDVLHARPISEEDLELLALLVTYPSDEPIARHLQVSVRTVRRRIARIMELLGVQNRFAAGVAAAQLGWVSHRPYR